MSRSSRRNWALLLLGLCLAAYGGLFVASLFASIHDPRTDRLLADVDRLALLAQAVLALALAWALQRDGRERVALWLFVAWFALAAVEVALLDWGWAVAYAMTGLVPLWLVWGEVRPPRRAA